MKQERILVVDDSEHFRNLIRTVLADRGHLVATAANGREAVEHVKRQMYDVIFIDLGMSDPPGLDILRAVRAIDPGPTMVLMLGRQDAGIVTDALDMAPFTVLSKSIQVHDLLKVVEG